jgi:hypothetical protein
MVFIAITMDKVSRCMKMFDISPCGTSFVSLGHLFLLCLFPAFLEFERLCVGRSGCRYAICGVSRSEEEEVGE